jgi:LmbE family N-acetylglucosaminyl deacetylase
VVVAHPDDAEIAMGGSIARMRHAGVRVVVAMLTHPEGANGAPRIEHAEKAAAILGHEPWFLGDSGQEQVSDIPETALVGRMDALLAELAPDSVFTHWAGDGHVDHRLTARAVAASLRNRRAELYAFRPAEPRVASNVGFAPTVFVDITEYAELKMRALEPLTVARPGFRPIDLEAIELSDRYHGSLSGTERAEAFEVQRQYGLGAVLAAG